MNQCDVVLRNPVRSAIGTDGGSLKEVPAPDFGGGQGIALALESI